MRIGLFLAAIAFCAVLYGLALSRIPETEAIEPSSFDAGYLIDDSIFYDSNTMTAVEIQKFLDDKSPACDMWGTGLITGRTYPDGSKVTTGTTRAAYSKVMREKYGKTQYHDPPYVCINKYYENPETHQTLYETQGVATAGMKSAAQIIYDVAQEYSINPQVLLVMIKKESLVWGDNWPLKYEYNTVMGYGCPDNAPCNEAYYGFYNQVQKAAWQFKYYREHPTSYHYKPNQNNNVYYHPNMACGTKQVYLENIATTSLYIYTPYTPNDAALRAYPGTGDGCSSYGNRNFYMFFKEWFGDTYEKINPITQKYNSLKNAKDILGEPVSEIKTTVENGASYQQYQNGYIVGTDKTGYYVSIGEIRERWESTGFEFGALGLPLSDVIVNPDNGTTYQQYQNGYIVGTDKTGYYVSIGEIRERWESTGFEFGALGLPLSDVIVNPDNGTTYQQYQNGYIVGTDKTGYYVSIGEIRERWESTGFEFGALGLPLSDISSNVSTGISWQVYEYGLIVGSESTGFYESRGKIREMWQSLGFESGILGFPISSIVEEPDGLYYQKYQRGVVYCNISDKCWIEWR